MGQREPSRLEIDRNLLEVRPFGEEWLGAFASFHCGDEDLDDFIRSYLLAQATEKSV